MEKFLNKIIHGDCIEVMQDIPSDSIDVTFADPPFNLKKEIRDLQGRKGNKRLSQLVQAVDYGDGQNYKTEWFHLSSQYPEMAYLLCRFPKRSRGFSALDRMGCTNGSDGQNFATVALRHLVLREGSTRKQVSRTPLPAQTVSKVRVSFKRLRWKKEDFAPVWSPRFRCLVRYSSHPS